MNNFNQQVHRHYRDTLGRAPRKASGFELGEYEITIVSFDDLPYEGIRTAMTVGLADRLQQEIIFSCHREQYLDNETTKLLGAVARQLLNSRRGVQHGEVLGPAGPIQPNTNLEAFYVCVPTFFPEALDPLTMSDGRHVHFFWLVPVHSIEARWIRSHDQERLAFEQALEHQDPDLLDLTRPPIQLG